MNNLCFLALGSNLNAPERQLRIAIKALSRHPEIVVLKTAAFFDNQALGRKSQPDFCNTVVAIKTLQSPDRLLNTCQQIEDRQGRQRRVKWGARTLDIDILFYGERRIKTPDLHIPHPALLNRDFVLIPLKELLPFFRLRIFDSL